MSEKDEEVLVEKVREFQKTKRPDDSPNTATILKEKRELSAPVSETEAKRAMFKRSRRTFLIGGATAVLGYLGYSWLRKPENTYLFERMFRFNENVSRAFFESSDLAPEFPRELAGARVNGMLGLDEELKADEWKLQVTGLANPQQFPQFSSDISFAGDNRQSNLTPAPDTSEPVSGLVFSLDDIKKLPRVEMTTELKCIEGWVQIVNWTGVRFSDFAAQFFPVLQTGEAPDLQHIPESLTKYVSLVTPDQEYYVGWDMQSILHPQTLLAYEMNGEPLKPEHGAPLRLVSTTKYGIKQLKRIGRIEFTNNRPADYWAENGYDWYSGH
ncbi:MAG: molybdopterin-dependent oxidoreductase [Pyrinomonadaceae bacterium]